ncbi:hypothetical protein SAMN05444279_103162 [Ruegeria intermedia]|uniref:Uncharacterized protein n=1 Tax=Ruegeria intermedia TaxID=996115 RepID=A0A1M4U406_9RHOB|nr:hypothetical protein SAMN05444279_103162 [Ruegeria intermedia]
MRGRVENLKLVALAGAILLALMAGQPDKHMESKVVMQVRTPASNS